MHRFITHPVLVRHFVELPLVITALSRAPSRHRDAGFLLASDEPRGETQVPTLHNFRVERRDGR